MGPRGPAEDPRSDRRPDRPYVTAQRLLEHQARSGRPISEPPRKMVLVWQASLLDRVRRERRIEPLAGVGTLLLGLAGTPPAVFRLSDGLGLALLSIGAPVVAIVVEELAALGVTTVVGVGYAGGIADDLEAGDLVICSSALRDEGTSAHYGEPGRFSLPDAGLTRALCGAPAAARLGPTWTTDAPYRETVEDIARHRAEGILTVDMEASALFSAADLLGIAAASAFCISDTLDGPAWEPRFQAPEVDQALFELFVAVEARLDATGPPA